MCWISKRGWGCLRSLSSKENDKIPIGEVLKIFDQASELWGKGFWISKNSLVSDLISIHLDAQPIITSRKADSCVKGYSRVSQDYPLLTGYSLVTAHRIWHGKLVITRHSSHNLTFTSHTCYHNSDMRRNEGDSRSWFLITYKAWICGQYFTSFWTDWS